MDQFGRVGYRGIVEVGGEPETRDFETHVEARRWAKALAKERECRWHVLPVGRDGRLLVEEPPELTAEDEAILDRVWADLAKGHSRDEQRQATGGIEVTEEKAQEQVTEKLADAMEYAIRLFRTDARKRSPVPVLSHLFSVCALVLHDGGDEDEAIAALLHDVLEDKPAPRRASAIKKRFGDRVLHLVQISTDTPPEYKGGPKEPWRIRKQRYLDHLGSTAPAHLRVTMADKVDNLRAMNADYRRLGEPFWARFNAGKQDQLWYFGEVVKAYRKAGATNALLDDLTAEFEKLVLLADRPSREARYRENPSLEYGEAWVKTLNSQPNDSGISDDELDDLVDEFEAEERAAASARALCAEASDAAARAARSRLLALGLASQIEIVARTRSGDPTPTPGLPGLMAGIELAAHTAAAEVDKARNLFDGAEAVAPELLRSHDAACAAALDAERLTRCLAQLTLGVSSCAGGTDLVYQVERAAVGVLAPPTGHGERVGLRQDGMAFAATSEAELSVEIGGLICRLLMDRGTQATLEVAGKVAVVFDVDADDALLVSTPAPTDEPAVALLREVGWPEPPADGFFRLRVDSPVRVRQPADLVARTFYRALGLETPGLVVRLDRAAR